MLCVSMSFIGNVLFLVQPIPFVGQNVLETMPFVNQKWHKNRGVLESIIDYKTQYNIYSMLHSQLKGIALMYS